jgi:heme/copper-type cytochrome/quinol oxidase subunit 2
MVTRGCAARGTRSLPLLGTAVIMLALACSPQSGPTRDVTLIARGMTFVLADVPGEPNPVIHLRTGERVRLILRNDAQGLLHDFEIPALNVKVAELRTGQTAEVTFTAPDSPGRYEYRCRPHAEMMRGFVEVR